MHEVRPEPERRMITQRTTSTNTARGWVQISPGSWMHESNCSVVLRDGGWFALDAANLAMMGSPFASRFRAMAACEEQL